MHYGENSILLGGKWRPYGRHFVLKTQKTEPQKHFFFEFFSSNNIVFLLFMPQHTLDSTKIFSQLNNLL
jgi:hypothetical protein